MASELQLLIIDDSSDDAFALERAIKKHSIAVHAQRVENADQLTEALSIHNWDMVFCDVRMPSLNVHEAIRLIDVSKQNIVSVVIFSGMVDMHEISSFIRGGVRDFVRKDQLDNIGDMVRREMGYLEARREQESEHLRFIEAQKMEAVGTLAGGVAHDFNNILTALMGMQWQIKSEYPELPALIEKIDKMDGLCDRASQMVKQLLGFARKGIVDMRPLELGQFIEDNQSLLRMSVPEHICLNWQKPEQEVYIKADEVQLQQMLINLVNNARDAVADVQSPCIVIRLEFNPGNIQEQGDESWIALYVMDNGSGMDETTKAHLFDPFYTTKKEGSGTGLGLAMVYGSMQEHHGFVDCEPADCDAYCHACELCLHQPTCFRLLFPVAEAALENSDSIPKEQAPKDNQCLRLLIADDEPMLREIMQAIFEDEGNSVEVCEDGLQAWQAFEKQPDAYDIIVLDVSMPKMTGPEVAKKIRTLSDVPIMLVSGYDMHQTMELIGDMQNIHIQLKPFQPDALITEVQHITGEAS